MFRWNLMLQPLFGLRRQQPKARRSKPTVKLQLEGLENRIVPSAAIPNPPTDLPVSSPPPAAAITAINSFLFSAVSHQIQVIATIQQDLLSEVKGLDQEIFQAFAALEQKWLNLFGFGFTASNQAPNDSVIPPINNGSGSGSGSGSGATTTHHNPDHSIHSFAALPGSGAGTGSSPDSSSGSATVYGNIWLDNNGDGSIDHGEKGYVGDGVTLYTSTGDVAGNAITDGNGNYSITIPMGQGQSGYYYIAVFIPQSDFATLPGYSQINAEGDSQVFELSMGSDQQINAGLRSMTVTTLLDDAAAAIPMQITLRDAMETGNNGLPASAVTFVPGLSGTISLQAELPPINANYNILGPTANPITVNGNDDTGTVFINNATSEIDNLVIEGGDGSDGGGIDDNGTLTLNADTGEDCDAGGSGGGLSSNGILPGGQAVYSGGFLYIPPGKGAAIVGGTYKDNTAGTFGGAIANFGTFEISGGTTFKTNTAKGSGGAIRNGEGGTVNATGNTQITMNTALGNGGGVASSGTFIMKGGSISRNDATYVGGGVNNSGGKMTLSNVQITGNSAGTGGGGIYVTAGTVTLKKDIIGPAGNVKNRTPTGGGIFIQGGAVNVTGGTIKSNTASRFAKPGTNYGNGGGIFNYAGSLTIKSGVNITNNAAHNQGGGIYLLIGSTTTFGPLVGAVPACTIDGNTAISNQGVGAYQQLIPPRIATVTNWNKFSNVVDNDDTKVNNPGRTGQTFLGP